MDYDWSEIQRAYDDGLSLRQLSVKFKCARTALDKGRRENKWVAHRIRTNGVNFIRSIDKYDWKEVQREHDNGLNWKELRKKFGVTEHTINIAKDLGLFTSLKRIDAITRKFKEIGYPKHSDETKAKISIARIAYITANPDKAPYLINHSSKKSYPEIVFENALLRNNIIGWEYNLPVGIYQYDFAFPELKLDVEIDGGTHLLEKVILIDERRDVWTRKNGWEVLRFTAKEVKNDVDKCLTSYYHYSSSFAVASGSR